MTTEGDWTSVEPDEHDEDESYISATTRRAVLDRDNWRCRHCGSEEHTALTLHHVKYRSHGGGHHADNLVTLCWSCHRMIHDKSLTVIRYNGHWYFRNKFHWRYKRQR